MDELCTFLLVRVRKLSKFTYNKKKNVPLGNQNSAIEQPLLKLYLISRNICIKLTIHIDVCKISTYSVFYTLSLIIN